MELCLSADRIRQYAGLRLLFSFDALKVYDGERVGLVGENGAGKTTLLRILSGELRPDAGRVACRVPVRMIRQYGEESGTISDPALQSLFAAPDERDGLSGGEKTRRRIAAALAAHPGLLLADEPTTDLDETGIERLEAELSAFPGALILVSHDRGLLDALTDKIWHIEEGTITEYPGNYSDFRRELENRRSFRQFEYDQYRAEQSRLRRAIQGEREHAAGVIKLPSRMGNSEARLHRRSATETEEKLHKTRKALQTRLEHLEEKQRPETDPDIRICLGASGGVVSRTAVEVRSLSLSFDSRVLLEKADMTLPTGSKTALLGPNGCGKSTLLRRIYAGDVNVRPGVRMAMLSQDMALALDLRSTALENAMADSILPQSAARTVLARLKLAGDDVFKPVSVLSGGERVKVALARLVLGQSNFLLLDEPTNHLDIFAVEALSQVLRAYTGTILLVSHDREFVRGVADRLVRFENRRLVTDEHPFAPPSPANADMERIRVEMRMAEISGKIGADEALQAEYLALARRRNELISLTQR